MRPWRQLFGRDWLIEVPYLAVPGYASDRNAEWVVVLALVLAPPLMLIYAAGCLGTLITTQNMDNDLGCGNVRGRSTIMSITNPVQRLIHLRLPWPSAALMNDVRTLG
ncbi:hypothetical protein An11g03720 [Aspergillus niger]|uniref:Uncharacterized protein n=2 Tax=Aspergillus niger TaxID=5061 RepID=A2QW37_ASPNC|nr:hypothetical protein An11g03720 [Aspergillus niger]CAK48360.1 hypothetical protein An11g03720 [Aspergillus niger]